MFAEHDEQVKLICILTFHNYNLTTDIQFLFFFFFLIVLRYNFDLSECNRVKLSHFVLKYQMWS